MIGHKKYFCAQSESSSFRVPFVTSYSKVFSPPNSLIACSPFIYLLVQESFPRSKSAIETRTMKPKKDSKFSMFVNQPEKASTEKIRLWTNRRQIPELQSTIISESIPCTWAFFVRVVSLSRNTGSLQLYRTREFLLHGLDKYGERAAGRLQTATHICTSHPFRGKATLLALVLCQFAWAP